MRLFNVSPLAKIPLPLPQILGYFSSAKNLKIGGLVSAPLGKRKVLGIIVGQKNVEAEKINIKMADYQLRPIDKVINSKPVITKQQLQLALWMHEYYYEPLGLIMKMMLPSNIVLNIESPAFAKASADAKALADRSAGRQIPNPKQIPNLKYQNPKLLQLNIKNGIDYFQKEITSTLNTKKQVLILVPEINNLTYLREEITPLISPLVRGMTATITSKVSPKQFREIWQKTAEGKIKIIFGTRKTLFLQFRDLGLIIITEEHSPHYKSYDQHPKYHARETAKKLAELCGAKMIMQSETPSIETKSEIRNPPLFLTEKAGQAKSETNTKCEIRNPDYKIIDMREEIKNGNYSIFSKTLLQEIRLAYAEKKKIILFINRRGESSAVLCRDCGHVIKCKNCETPMILHGQIHNSKFIIQNSSLTCHHCGYKETASDLCPQCRGHRLKFLGAGTQKVETELKKILPGAEILRLDSDTAKNSKARQKIAEKFNKSGAILVGTQLINNINLEPADFIGIISLETMLNMPDFRSGERTFQTIYGLLNKVKKSGMVMCQSHSPDHYAIKNGFNKDYEKFYKEELDIRKLFSYPPFSQIIKLTFSHKNKEVAERETKRLYEKLSTINYQLSTIIGPAPAFIPKKRTKYAWNIIIKANNQKLENRNQLLRLVPSDWKVDVDPESLL